MMMNLLVIAMLGGIGYIWAARGFLSALLHFGCVLAAGAIALSLWETIAYALLDALDTQWMIDLVWGASLLIPFAVLVAILTSAMNALVRSNTQCDGVTNIVGGGLCGLGTAVITSGITVISLSMVRSAPDFLGYQPVVYDSQGSLVHGDSLWVPVDRLTMGAYSMISEGTMATGDPLAKWRPSMAIDGHLLRVAPSENTLKYTLRPKDVGFMGRFTIGDGATAVPYKDLVGDTKKVLDFNGDDLARENNGQFYVEGVLLKFMAGAREKNGQVVIGPGHVQLVLRSADDTESIAVQPFAMFSQAKGDDLRLGRWRFDGKEVFIASSVGADPMMGFEFLVPRRANEVRWLPVAVYVRGVRFNLTDVYTEQPVKPMATYTSASEYITAVDSRGILSDAVAGLAALDETQKATFNANNITGVEVPFRITNQLPPGVVLNKGDIRSIDIDDKNRIVGGRSRFERKNLLQRGSEKTLEVRAFAPGENSAIVQINVSPTVGSEENPFNLLGGASEGAEGAPALIDSLGQRYEVIGFVYEDANAVEIAFQPGSPVTAINQLPSMSKSRTDQKLTLIFRVSMNVSIASYVIGNKAVSELKPPPKADQMQR